MIYTLVCLYQGVRNLSFQKTLRALFPSVLICLLKFATINWTTWTMYINKKYMVLYSSVTQENKERFHLSHSSVFFFWPLDLRESNIDILFLISLPAVRLYIGIPTYRLLATMVKYLTKLKIWSSYSSFSLKSTKVTWQPKRHHQYYHVFIPTHLTKLQVKSNRTTCYTKSSPLFLLGL